MREDLFERLVKLLWIRGVGPSCEKGWTGPGLPKALLKCSLVFGKAIALEKVVFI
jgi:hypothetical protein